MNIYDLLSKKIQKPTSEGFSIKNDNEQLSNIAKAFKEDDANSFDSANSFEDFGGGGMQDFGGSGMDQGGFDTGNDFGGDFGGGGFDDFNDGQDQQGQLPKSAMDFLENIDESEVKLVEDLAKSFSSLYTEQKTIYSRLLSENLEITDYTEEVEKIKNQYRTTLKILREYIVNKYHVETTVSRVETFVEFKFIFENLSTALNNIMKRLTK